MKCSQCENPTILGVCDDCIDAARKQLEGALGGRPTSLQIARIFDMGGAGIAPRGCHSGQPVIKMNWSVL